MNRSAQERRAYLRLRLRLPAQLTRAAAQPKTLHVVTENICAGGFYCTSPERLEQGEQVDCLIEVAAQILARPALRLSLLAGVVRVEKLEEQPGMFGIALRVHDYRVARQETVSN